jgi:hypothetical protein
MPYATNTPNANEAITAHTNINELIANLLSLLAQLEPNPVHPPTLFWTILPVL